jgi:predicted phosphodiesterase
VSRPTGQAWRNWKKAEVRKGVHPNDWAAHWDATHSKAKAPAKPDDIQALIEATRKPIGFEALCDKLGKPPAAVRLLIDLARVRGIGLQLGNEHLQLSPNEQVRTVQQTRILPTTSEQQMVGAISDTHLGSKYCLRSQLRDTVGHMYSRGIRHILHSGDLLDGCYQHGVFELSHTGLEDQTGDLFETLPQLPGLNYHAITGNHDHTFTEKTGVNVGGYIRGYFQDRGREDIKFYGQCGAFIEIMGAVVELWHPLKGMGYAKSYQLQRHIEDYGAGEKPHILLAGHWHQFCYVEHRGVFAVAMPTFQASGSVFSKRLGGQPAMGGVILTWEIAGKDMVRNCGVERRRYFEIETPQKVRAEAVA